MEDTVKNKIPLEIAELLDSHRAIDTTVLDIRSQCSWTDYFIIATATSHTHMKGLFDFVRGYLTTQKIKPAHGHKQLRDQGWTLLDCGNFVIHLMSRETREFYELERLWYSGKVIYHSSKSS